MVSSCGGREAAVRGSRGAPTLGRSESSARPPPSGTWQGARARPRLRLETEAGVNLRKDAPGRPRAIPSGGDPSQRGVRPPRCCRGAGPRAAGGVDRRRCHPPSGPALGRGPRVRSRRSSAALSSRRAARSLRGPGRGVRPGVRRLRLAGGVRRGGATDDRGVQRGPVGTPPAGVVGSGSRPGPRRRLDRLRPRAGLDRGAGTPGGVVVPVGDRLARRRPRARPGAERRATASQARGTRHPGRDRGTQPDRPGAPRRDRAQRQHHDRAGVRRAAQARGRSGRRTRGPRDRGDHRATGAGRDAPHGRGAAPERRGGRPRASTRAGRADATGRTVPGGGSPGRTSRSPGSPSRWRRVST